MSMKYVFITGGVLSSLGKGITTASIGLLLEKRGYSVCILKLDPYLNVDPGTMNPYEHGEVYVTDDGTETDLDLGHYHRFTHSLLSKLSNTTSGQIYEKVIQNERKGKYLGKTVQVIPHITNAIQDHIRKVSKEHKCQIVLIEIGGTVGDIESLPFIEAIRQFCNDHREDCLKLHLTYVPYLNAAGEFKTKPTQHSVQTLLSLGIIPDMILCRSEKKLLKSVKNKISLFCNVTDEDVIVEEDVKHNVYEVPIHLHEQSLDAKILKKLNLPLKKIQLNSWKTMVQKMIKPKHKATIGLVGKYHQHQDAYKSVFASLVHSATHLNTKLNIITIDPEILTSPSSLNDYPECEGFIVPGGFGDRGWHGKLYTAQYARENHIPYFGLCLGMQVLLVEFARNVLGLSRAHSTEVLKSTPHPIVSLLTEQKKIKNLGGTMRLGAFPCKVHKGTLAYKAYKSTTVHERHRHRYEFNNAYKKEFEDHGMVFSGQFVQKGLCEIAELKDHPWMLGVQFHPEFLSRPLEPHPLFVQFIKAVTA